MESEFFIVAFGWNLLCFIKINDVPSLILSVMNFMSNNWLSFSIFCSFNIKSFAVLDVDELVSSILEDLPPL
jgi:hypothetical protein